MSQTIELSVVIVNYKVRDLLAQTIRSVRSADGYEFTEIIVVDNDSRDGSEELVLNEFPDVRWVGLKTNVGFGKACNIGAELANGSLLLMLNPDTIVSTDTLTTGIEFMKSHPDVGVLSPRVLNQDGTFYKQCHRGLPTPINAFGHFTGLSRIFPKNKQLSSYFMSWLSPDEEHEVDAVSGSCFFIPADLYAEIGGFDETFFMYGEDLDICVQAKLRGKKVWYAPISKIIHFQGKSSAQRKLRSRLAFYNAMIIFSRKYAGSYGSFFPPKLIEVAVFLQAALAGVLSLSRRLPSFLLDMGIINTLLPIVTTIRFSFLYKENPYTSMEPYALILVHIIASSSLATSFLIFDMIGKKTKNYLTEAGVSLAVCLSTLFMAHTITFSRLSLLTSAIISLSLMVAWRVAGPRFSRGFSRLVQRKQKTFIISEEPILSKLLEKLGDEQLDIAGIVSTGEAAHKELCGYPVLGALSELADLVEKNRPDLLIIASASDWYSTIIENLSAGVLNNVTIQWLPPNNPGGELKEFSLS